MNYVRRTYHVGNNVVATIERTSSGYFLVEIHDGGQVYKFMFDDEASALTEILSYAEI